MKINISCLLKLFLLSGMTKAQVPDSLNRQKDYDSIVKIAFHYYDSKICDSALFYFQKAHVVLPEGLDARLMINNFMIPEFCNQRTLGNDLYHSCISDVKELCSEKRYSLARRSLTICYCIFILNSPLPKIYFSEKRIMDSTMLSIPQDVVEPQSIDDSLISLLDSNVLKMKSNINSIYKSKGDTAISRNDLIMAEFYYYIAAEAIPNLEIEEKLKKCRQMQNKK